MSCEADLSVMGCIKFLSCLCLTGRISYSRIGVGEISPAGLVFSACQKKHAEKDVANLTDVVCNAKSYVSEYFLIWESHLCHNLTIVHKNM